MRNEAFQTLGVPLARDRLRLIIAGELIRPLGSVSVRLFCSGELCLAANRIVNSARRSSPLQQTETLPASSKA